MKLEARFTSHGNRLFSLDGTECPAEGAAVLDAAQCRPGADIPPQGVLCIWLPWGQVGTEDGGYNEEFLAAFRDFLKELEEQGRYAFIVPDGGSGGFPDGGLLAASMKHCARRIKDCASVIGFAVPPAGDASYFMEQLREKHAHYIFFSRDESLLADGGIVRY